MAMKWKYSDNARWIIENKNKMEEKQSGLKMSLERVWVRTVALIGVNRATAQRIINKKDEQPTPSIKK